MALKKDTDETIAPAVKPEVVVEKEPVKEPVKEPEAPAVLPVLEKVTTEAELADAAAKAEAASLLNAQTEQERFDNDAAVALQEGRKPKERKMVEVENLRNSDFRQPETGIWIRAKSREWLLQDGWLENQCGANLLKEV